MKPYPSMHFSQKNGHELSSSFLVDAASFCTSLAVPDTFFGHNQPPRRLTIQSFPIRASLAATCLSLVASLCAGCAQPFHHFIPNDGCGELVSADSMNGPPAASDCSSSDGCHDNFASHLGHTIVHTACLPYKLCCHTLNFCAPDGAVGPPDIVGPGRFFPVPTHPVFAPPQAVPYQSSM